MMVTAMSMDAGMDDKEALRLHIVGMLESLGKGGTTSNGGEPTEPPRREKIQYDVGLKSLFFKVSQIT